MIPLGIALSITSAVALYLLVAVVALGVLGGDALAASEAPILDAAKRFMGPLATPVIVLAAVLAIGKSLNAIFIVFSRSLFAMGRAGVLPEAFARVHPRWGTPHVACARERFQGEDARHRSSAARPDRGPPHSYDR